jgi:hypothetical protein
MFLEKLDTYPAKVFRRITDPVICAGNHDVIEILIRFGRSSQASGLLLASHS